MPRHRFESIHDAIAAVRRAIIVDYAVKVETYSMMTRVIVTDGHDGKAWRIVRHSRGGFIIRPIKPTGAYPIHH